MALPDSLTEQLYLLACDPERGTLARRRELGYVLRAAALVDLQLAGCLRDEDGRPAVSGGTPATDPIRSDLLHRIAESRPRRWTYWIRTGTRVMVPGVGQRLADARHVVLEPHRILGLFPTVRVRIPDPLLRQRIATTVESALAGMTPVDGHDAALVALAWAAESSRLMSRADRRAYRTRIAGYVGRTGPVPPALRRIIRSQRSAAAASG